MSALSPTVGELFKAQAITDHEVRAVVEAYMTNPTTTLFLMSERDMA